MIMFHGWFVSGSGWLASWVAWLASLAASALVACLACLVAWLVLLAEVARLVWLAWRGLLADWAGCVAWPGWLSRLRRLG
mgnify:CR=1 FL=1